ncbi:MAG: TIGR00725 family protein [bacterium]|nr:TIGR00725 family protein [bacterium]
MIVGIIGGSQIEKKEIYDMAYATGALVARNQWVLICGGLGGVMEAAAKGAFDQKGVTIGILPQNNKSYANPYITIPVATGIGLARNFIIVHTADILIAIDGQYGTLNEIAAAMTMKKYVLSLRSWDLEKLDKFDKTFFIPVQSPEEAVHFIKNSSIH